MFFSDAIYHTVLLFAILTSLICDLVNSESVCLRMLHHSMIFLQLQLLISSVQYTITFLEVDYQWVFEFSIFAQIGKIFSNRICNEPEPFCLKFSIHFSSDLIMLIETVICI